METIISALVTTLVVVSAVPVIGYTIDKIVMVIIKLLNKLLGSRITEFIVNKLTFIGTVHHELSHALLAILTGAKVIKVNAVKHEGDSLGSVSLVTRGPALLKSIQLSLTAVAPIICGAATSYILYIVLKTIEMEVYFKVLITYSLLSIIIHMRMSKADLKNYIKGCWLISFILMVMLIVLKVDIFDIVNYVINL